MAVTAVHSNLNEELGQIERIFSDKTEMLIENRTKFLWVSAISHPTGRGRHGPASSFPIGDPDCGRILVRIP
jgi:magnesium-transporting ATPase (P-type)